MVRSDFYGELLHSDPLGGAVELEWAKDTNRKPQSCACAVPGVHKELKASSSPQHVQPGDLSESAVFCYGESVGGGDGRAGQASEAEFGWCLDRACCGSSYGCGARGRAGPTTACSKDNGESPVLRKIKRITKYIYCIVISEWAFVFP